MAPELTISAEAQKIDEKFEDELKVDKTREPLTFDSEFKKSVEDLREIIAEEDAEQDQE